MTLLSQRNSRLKNNSGRTLDSGYPRAIAVENLTCSVGKQIDNRP